MSAGVFDFLFTTPGYHQAQTGVGNMFDAVNGDLDKRRQSGLVQWADDYYNKHYGLRILALHPAPGNHFVLREPLGTDGTLNGLKVRSNATFDGVVRQLGGTPVNMSPADAYSAMQKGVLDGITFPGLRVGRLQALRGRQVHDAAGVRTLERPADDQREQARIRCRPICSRS